MSSLGFGDAIIVAVKELGVGEGQPVRKELAVWRDLVSRPKRIDHEKSCAEDRALI